MMVMKVMMVTTSAVAVIDAARPAQAQAVSSQAARSAR
jgi:hypothetical protein